MTIQEVLRGGRQCDEDGTEIIMSRQACVEAADLLDQMETDSRSNHESYSKLAAAYHELLYAVGNIHRDETRHQTALRYIREAESHDPAPASVSEN